MFRCMSDAGIGVAMTEALNNANSTPVVHTGGVQALPPGSITAQLANRVLILFNCTDLHGYTQVVQLISDRLDTQKENNLNRERERKGK